MNNDDYEIMALDDFLVGKVNKVTGKVLTDDDGLPVLFRIPKKDRLRIERILKSIDINKIWEW
tara:strand:+ start:85 stop:273 length:189 start_codon:yes stop_codon:yes gene_type:complete